MKKIALCIVLITAVFSLQACKTDKEAEKPTKSTKPVAVSEQNDQPAVTPISNEKPLRFGYMICDSRKLSEERFAPFTAYLEKKLGRRVEMILENTFEFEKLVRNKEVDFFHVNSIVAVLLKEKYKADLLAIDIRGRNGYKATGALIARKDSGIETIEDMRGKSLVFGPAMAPFGYMAQYAMMLDNNFDPETDLASYTIPAGAAKHDKVIYGVEYGKYDIGAAPRIDLDRLVNEDIININDYNIIAESDPMPYCTIGARQEIDAALKEQVKEILLNLKDDEVATVDGETLKVLKRMLIEGFAPVVDSEYDAIREDLKLCNMPPYTTY
jgi:phosphonate transport system substrate-binding protein